VHPSAEHVYLYFFLATFFVTCPSSCADESTRFLFDVILLRELVTDGLLTAAGIDVLTLRRRVEETSPADKPFFFFFASLATAAAAAAASAFLS
jgi:hypothetical protein